MSYEKTTIRAALSRIRNRELFLPAIQRDFVWEPERMYKLLDSIFRGYPFSTMLFWNTKQRVQYREFSAGWSQDLRYTFLVKEEGKKGTMVLDGQQRLQTFYLALFGQYNHKIMYFDLLSGNEPDDISESKYHFGFLSTEESESLNGENNGEVFWAPLRDVAQIKGNQIAAKSIFYLTKLGIPADSEAGMRVAANINAAYFALRGDEAINYFIVDKEYGDGGSPITNLDEILEIFVRVNSGGQVLSKSDLMFSLLQMHWEGASDAVTELTENLNEMGRYKFDKDFILKCALVCCGKGAKYEVKKLRDEETIAAVQSEFPRIEKALLNLTEFLVSDARLRDNRILRSNNTLLIFVYFFYLQPQQDVRGEDIRLQLVQTLYLALMTRVLSRFADNYTDQIVKNTLIPANELQPGFFPQAEIIKFIHQKQDRDHIDDWLLQDNILLLMNILEGGAQLPEGRRSRRPEVDHIFPKGELPAYGYKDEQINHFANFRLISRIDNNWKRNKDPKPYFTENPGAAKKYFIPTDLLEYEQYELFLEKRREMIWNHLNHFFGFDGSAPEPILSEIPEVVTLPVEERKEETDGPVITSTSLKDYCLSLLTPDEFSNPYLQDQDLWWDVMPDTYSKQWKGIYRNALKKVGILTVSDLVACIMALKLRIVDYGDDGNHNYEFSQDGPDGEKIVLWKFGRWGWDLTLGVLEERGFDWRGYVFNEKQ